MKNTFFETVSNMSNEKFSEIESDLIKNKSYRTLVAIKKSRDKKRQDKAKVLCL